MLKKIYYSLTDNLKSRDARASKKWVSDDYLSNSDTMSMFKFAFDKSLISIDEYDFLCKCFAFTNSHLFFHIGKTEIYSQSDGLTMGSHDSV